MIKSNYPVFDVRKINSIGNLHSNMEKVRISIRYSANN